MAAARPSWSSGSLQERSRRRRGSRSRNTSRGSRNTCRSDPAHPAEDPLADGLGHVPHGGRSPPTASLGRRLAGLQEFDDILRADDPRIEGGDGLADLIEEVAVAAAGLAQLPGEGEGPGALVSPAEGPR